MAAAVVAYGAASALGIGSAAFDLGGASARPSAVWTPRDRGKLFGRVTGCAAPASLRPAALLGLGLGQVVEQLDAERDGWRRLRLGVVIGTSSGGLPALERALASPAADAAEWPASAYFAPLDVVSAHLGRAPERLVALHAACASSTLALGLGARWLELGLVDLVIAGGYDAQSEWVCAGFDALKATAAGPPRPFRAERDGMVLGEGVALIALTEEQQAPLGFVSGFAASSDACHITAPDRSGQALARAARAALDDAGCGATDIGFVSVHGTGTTFNDAAEAAALRSVFGERAASLHLQAFKSLVGHTLGAAGALESLSALAALKGRVLPASASHGSPMSELPAVLADCNLPGQAEHCLKLSTAFGGANAALVLSRKAPQRPRRTPRPVYLLAAGIPCRQLVLERVAGLLVASPERLPRSDELSELTVAAVAELLRIQPSLALDRRRVGIVVGSMSASLEADAAFGARVLARGSAFAEPRRFPATSPNACAGHASIAFGLGGPSHAVGAGPAAAIEALEVAADWLAAGDAEAMLVVSAESVGMTARRALETRGISAPDTGGFAVLLGTAAAGPWLSGALRRRARERASGAEMLPFGGLRELVAAAGLPEPEGFGSVRPPE